MCHISMPKLFILSAPILSFYIFLCVKKISLNPFAPTRRFTVA